MLNRDKNFIVTPAQLEGGSQIVSYQISVPDKTITQIVCPAGRERKHVFRSFEDAVIGLSSQLADQRFQGLLKARALTEQLEGELKKMSVFNKDRKFKIGRLNIARSQAVIERNEMLRYRAAAKSGHLDELTYIAHPAFETGVYGIPKSVGDSFYVLDAAGNSQIMTIHNIDIKNIVVEYLCADIKNERTRYVSSDMLLDDGSVSDLAFPDLPEGHAVFWDEDSYLVERSNRQRTAKSPAAEADDALDAPYLLEDPIFESDPEEQGENIFEDQGDEIVPENPENIFQNSL